ncbi:BglG family transcription antiterminator [Pectinatus frisingensis]|uniref:BglG family transcription antiterminator n=1 Tax=Pectinatus frisingensis TaxID=865 RepID=UPI003D805F6D
MTSENLSAREKKILAVLFKTNSYITAAYLSKLLCVSEKTIYRDLKSIQYNFKSKNLIQQDRGKGYRLNYTPSLKNILCNSNQGNTFSGIDVETRRRNITVLLLLQTPVETSINKLAELYFISNASIVNDLNIIEQELLQYDLSLIRSHNGTHIKGDEYNIRRLLMQKISLFSVTNDSFLVCENNDTANEHDLYTFFSHKDISFVKLLLDKAEQMLCGKIKDPYYINIFTHILILLKRLENNKNLCIKDSYKKYQYSNVTITKCTQLIVNELKKYLNKTIPDDEIFYIYQYLYSSRIDMDNGTINVEVTDIHNKETVFVDDLILKISQAINCDFTNDFNLKTSLLLHIRPLTKRIENNIFISNPLKNDVKENFGQVYRAVDSYLKKQLLKPVFKNLSDDEISYIAVYFQVSLEKRVQQKRVGIVCSSGIGTSHLLAARVKKHFLIGK